MSTSLILLERIMQKMCKKISSAERFTVGFIWFVGLSTQSYCLIPANVIEFSRTHSLVTNCISQNDATTIEFMIQTITQAQLNIVKAPTSTKLQVIDLSANQQNIFLNSELVTTQSILSRILASTRLNPFLAL